MRLDKFIAKSTTLNKQQVIVVIQAEKILVNNILITDCAFQVHENNHVTLEGRLLKTRPFRYLLMHKPAHTICSNIDEVYPSALNLLKLNNDIEHVSELHIAGRLDVDTTGLILITDDGRWTFNITLPTNNCSKIYRVNLSKVITQDIVKRFAEGIQLQGEANLTLPAFIEVINSKEVLLTLTEGKFHQVKRMFSAVGNRVVKLHREQIGDVKLDVAAGKWRYLTPLEINSFYK
ncbi:pseudouridine synthase [Psychromonas sp. RZ22]|uniref:pseudouridine synthase n=1 Tax=Psychromonas algarum TaxID=2555643 RepID=UPI0010687F0F|nr:pseudouridine synthase [Psychromonas sp. RZ22]TEW55285.1 pseudouridine synthase [Psychromonas sp. RZ22]